MRKMLGFIVLVFAAALVILPARAQTAGVTATAGLTNTVSTLATGAPGLTHATGVKIWSLKRTTIAASCASSVWMSPWCMKLA